VRVLYYAIAPGGQFVWQAPLGGEIIGNEGDLYRIEVDALYAKSIISVEISRLSDGSLVLLRDPNIRYFFRNAKGHRWEACGDSLMISETASEPLMDPEFSLEEIEQAQEVMDGLS